MSFNIGDLFRSVGTWKHRTKWKTRGCRFERRASQIRILVQLPLWFPSKSLLNRNELLRDLSLTELLLACSQSDVAAIAFICVFVAESSNSLPFMLASPWYESQVM
ncbi:hypothetical protein SADUNF_Sadunf09G0107600 [Salix dunnii]|uniref:Uncharacterized protein n=1 Tax=Salix dunnii TaxID=1413687 RepID=A0A835JWB1_9ROSI|nr:hypothetical protein SADUNF_Sadunf09G0107600 [Salix dunnii]